MKIKTTFLSFFTIGFLGVSQFGIAAESEGASLTQKNRCYGCHHLSNTLIGPSYQAIAARHKANKDIMVDVLAEKIIIGGGGTWGVVPMVPNEHVSDEEARQMAQWILESAP